jgi:hypothetical protein
MLLFQSLAPYIANSSAHKFLAVDAAVPTVLRGDCGQCLSRSHLLTQHRLGVPELHLVLLVPGVEKTVRAAIAQPRRSVSGSVTQESGITLEKDYIIIL